MGKKEQLEELDKQLNKAKKTKRSSYIGFVTGLVFLLLFWPLGIFFLAIAIVLMTSSNNKVNQINLEKAKLK